MQSLKARADQRVTVWLSLQTLKAATWPSMKDNLSKMNQAQKDKNCYVLIYMLKLKKLKSCKQGVQ